MMKQQIETSPDLLVELVTRLQRARVEVDAEVASARAAFAAAREDLVRAVESGGKTDSVEKRAGQADQGIAVAELRATATHEALSRAERALEAAARSTELERQKAIHGVAVEAHALARERVPQAWASLEKAFSECARLQSAARWSYATARDLGATLENRTPQEVTTHAELTLIRRRVQEIHAASGDENLNPPPPAISIAGYQTSQLS